MTEVGLRRKRPAGDEGQVDENPFKRSRYNEASLFRWLWSPPHPPSSRPPSASGLWSQTIPSGMFLTCHDVPRPFSVPPEATHKRPRRRGAISVTASSSPSELDRHLAQQLQQQVAIIRLKAAAEGRHAADKDCCQGDHRNGDDDDDAEVDQMRRELEAVQIDAALPSILGFSIDFDRKLCLGPSGRSPEASDHRDTGSPAGAGSAISSCPSTCCSLWGSGEVDVAGDANLSLPQQRSHAHRQHVSGGGGGGGGGGLWRLP